jgi:hypothetical protein
VWSETGRLEVKVVTLKIAGIVFRTESNARLPWLQKDPYVQFLTGDEKPAVRHFFSKIGFDPIVLSPLSMEEQKILARQDGFRPDWLNNPVLKCPQVRSRLKVLTGRPEEMEIWVGENYVYMIDFSCNRLDIFYTEKFGGYVTERQRYMPEHYVAANFRQIFSTFFSQFAAFLLHGSGVIRRERAVLFLASDGGGKTTVVAQSNGEPVLNDDQIIIRQEGEDVTAHGTPLGVITSGPCQAPVGALFMLEKSSSFQIEPVSPSELVQYLWSEHQNYTFFLPKHLKKRVFRLLCDLCYRIPVYLMRFPKDHVDWDAIDAVME